MVNLLTNSDEAIEAFAEVEGEDWTLWSMDQTDSFTSIAGATKWLWNLPDGVDLDHVLFTIYGPGGIHRYFVDADGEVFYGKFYGMSGKLRATDAGFAIR